MATSSISGAYSRSWNPNLERMNITGVNQLSFEGLKKDRILETLSKTILVPGDILSCINSINFSLTHPDSRWHDNDIIKFFDYYLYYLPTSLECTKTIDFSSWTPSKIIAFLEKYEKRLPFELENLKKMDFDSFNMHEVKFINSFASQASSAGSTIKAAPSGFRVSETDFKETSSRTTDTERSFKEKIDKINEVIEKLNLTEIHRFDINSLTIDQLLRIRANRFTSSQLRSLNLSRFNETSFKQFFANPDLPEISSPLGIDSLSGSQINHAASLMPAEWFTHLELTQIKEIDFKSLTELKQRLIPLRLAKRMKNFIDLSSSSTNSSMPASESPKKPVFSSHATSVPSTSSFEATPVSSSFTVTKERANLQDMTDWSKQKIIDYICKIDLPVTDTRPLTCMNRVDFSNWLGVEVMSVLNGIKNHLPSPLISITTINFSSWTPLLVNKFFNNFKHILPNPLPNLSTVNLKQFSEADKAQFFVNAQTNYAQHISSEWNEEIFNGLCETNQESLLTSKLEDFQIRDLNLDKLSSTNVQKLIKAFSIVQLSNLSEDTIKKNISKIDATLKPKLIEAGFEDKFFGIPAVPGSREEKESKNTEVPTHYFTLKQRIINEDSSLDYTQENFFNGFSKFQNDELFRAIPEGRKRQLSWKGIQNNIKNISGELLRSLPSAILHKLDINSFEKDQLTKLHSNQFSKDQIGVLNFSKFDVNLFYEFFQGNHPFYGKTLKVPCSKLKEISFNRISLEKMEFILTWMPVDWFRSEYLTDEQLDCMDYTRLGTKQRLIDRTILSKMKYYMVSTSSMPEETSESEFVSLTFDQLLTFIKNPSVNLNNFSLNYYNEDQIEIIFNLVPEKVIQIKLETIRLNIKKIKPIVIKKLDPKTRVHHLDINSLTTFQLVSLKSESFSVAQIKNLDFKKFDSVIFLDFFTKSFGKDRTRYPDLQIQFIPVEKINEVANFLDFSWFDALTDFQIRNINYLLLGPKRNFIKRVLVEKMQNAPRSEFTGSTSGREGPKQESTGSSGSRRWSRSNFRSWGSSSSSSSTSSPSLNEWAHLPSACQASIIEAQRYSKDHSHIRPGTKSKSAFYNRIRENIKEKGVGFSPRLFYKIWKELRPKEAQSEEMHSIDFKSHEFFNEANIVEIKKLSKEIWAVFHPDKNPEDKPFAEAMFKALTDLKDYYEKTFDSSKK